MFRKAKLRTKMFGGFFCVIGLVAAVGVMALSSMTTVSNSSTNMADVEMPQLDVGVELQSSMGAVLVSTRNYHFTAAGDYEAEVRKRITEVETLLQKYLGIAQSHNDAKLIATVEDYRVSIDKFEALFNETVDLNRKLAETRKTASDAAEKFIKAFNDYINGQGDKLLADLKAGATAEKLEERIWKLRVANDAIDIVNNIRVENQRSQALRDASIIHKAFADLKKINDILQQILAKTTQENDRVGINAIIASLTAWEQAANQIVELREKGEEVANARAPISNHLLAAIVEGAGTSVDRMTATTRDTADSLGAATMALITGLFVAGVLAIAIAWFITNGILSAVDPILTRAKAIAAKDLTGTEPAQAF